MTKFATFPQLLLLFLVAIFVLPVNSSCKRRPKDDNMFRPVLTRDVFLSSELNSLNLDSFLPAPAMDVPSYTFDVKVHQNCIRNGGLLLGALALDEYGELLYAVELRSRSENEFDVYFFNNLEALEAAEKEPAINSLKMTKNDTDNAYIIHFVMKKKRGGQSRMQISGDDCASSMADVPLRDDSPFVAIVREPSCHASFIGKPTFPGWFSPPVPKFTNGAEETEDEQTKRDRETHRKIVEKEHSSFRSSHRHDKREGAKEVCEKCTKELGGDIGRNELTLSKLSQMTVATQYTMALFVILFGFILFGIMKAWSSSALSLSIIQTVKNDMKTYQSATSQTGTNEKTNEKTA